MNENKYKMDENLMKKKEDLGQKILKTDDKMKQFEEERERKRLEK